MRDDIPMTNQHDIMTATDTTLAALMLHYFDDITDTTIDDYIAIALHDDDTRSLHAILADALAHDIRDLMHNSNLDTLLPFIDSLHLSDADYELLTDRLHNDFDTDELAHLILTRLP